MNDLDALLNQDPAVIERQAQEAEIARAKDNRPPYLTNPTAFTGTWDGKIVEGTETNEKTGQTFPRLEFHFTKCHDFVVKPAQVGQYVDGQDYVVAMRVPDPTDKKLYMKEWGMMQTANKAPLSTFANCEVRLEEQAQQPWKNAFDKESNRAIWKYFYKWTKVGAGAAATPSEPTQEGVAAALGLLLGEGMTEPAFKSAAMVTPGIGKPLMSGGRNDTVLIAKIGDGSWVREMVEAGKVVRDGDVLKVVG